MILFKKDDLLYGTFDGKEWVESFAGGLSQFARDRYCLNGDGHMFAYYEGDIEVIPLHLVEGKIAVGSGVKHVSREFPDIKQENLFFVSGGIALGSICRCVFCKEDYYWGETKNSTCGACEGTECT